MGRIMGIAGFSGMHESQLSRNSLAHDNRASVAQHRHQPRVFVRLATIVYRTAIPGWGIACINYILQTNR
jgi:hypothetical protein